MKELRCSAEEDESAAVAVNDEGEFGGGRRVEGAEEAEEGGGRGVERDVFGEGGGGGGGGIGGWGSGGHRVEAGE